MTRKKTNKNKIKTFNGFLEKKNLRKIKKNADLILASNVFAHSDNLKEMAECMLNLLSSKGTIIIEVQYLMNTMKDLTFDNIYHEHYNYWSLTSLINFFKQFNATIYKAEKINTHGGSIRIYIKKGKKTKIDKSVNQLIKEENNYGIKDFKTYQKFGEKVYNIRNNVIKNLNKLKKQGKKIIGYGSPAKATTALNFFGTTDQIDFIVEDNKLKHNKYIPGVKIPIYSKDKVKEYMIDNAKSAIEQMVSLAEEMSINIFNASSYDTPAQGVPEQESVELESNDEEKEEEVQPAADDGIIRVDLGNGKFGKINVDNLNNAGAPQ